MRRFKKSSWKDEKKSNQPHKTLDSFMHGLSDSENSSFLGSKKIIPKIKVPANSGTYPLLKPICQKFVRA